MKTIEQIIKSNDELDEQMKSVGFPAIFSIAYLHGIKCIEEYQSGKTTTVRKNLKERGYTYLLENPIFTTLVPYQSGSMICIFNGHHRTRNAPEYGFHFIPSIIFPIEAVASFVSMPVDVLVSKLIEWHSQSIESFSRKYNSSGKSYALPKLLTGVRSIEDIQQNIVETHGVHPYIHPTS